MSSFSIRDILDLPEDTIRTSQAIKKTTEMSSTCTLPDQPTELASNTTETSQHTDDDMAPTNGILSNHKAKHRETTKSDESYFHCSKDEKKSQDDAALTGERKLPRGDTSDEETHHKILDDKSIAQFATNSI
ncbi:hypothetical protein QZH41_004474 [Actinostola sp. cb2023]|nr:hypothetical protein QZH41_004474 [Actinostola sp. cb2023]